jgi:hypothetical protein
MTQLLSALMNALRAIEADENLRSYGNKNVRKPNSNPVFYKELKTRIDGVNQVYTFARRAGDPGPINDDREWNVTNPKINHIARVIAPHTPDFTYDMRYGSKQGPEGDVYGDAMAHFEYVNQAMDQSWNARRLTEHYDDKHVGEMNFQRNNALLLAANAALMEKLKKNVDDPRLHAAIERNLSIKKTRPVGASADRDGYKHISTELAAHASLVALAQHHGLLEEDSSIGKGLLNYIGNSKGQPQMVNIMTHVPEGYLGMTTTPGREVFRGIDTPTPKPGGGILAGTSVGKQDAVHKHLQLMMPEPVTAYALDEGKPLQIRPREISPFHLKVEVKSEP